MNKLDIEYTRAAVKAINGLDKPVKSRIREGLDHLPGGDIKKLKGYANHYRLRIGDYRVLFQFFDDRILITDVLPRGAAYKNI